MIEIFVDTSGWGNLIDPTQPYHGIASSIYRSERQKGSKFVTTNYIIAELVALMISPLRIPRPKAVSFIEGVKTSPFVEILNIHAKLDEDAWDLFRKHQDKAWSLVDCATFVVMKQRGITSALTSDHHFEQAGFVRLLK